MNLKSRGLCEMMCLHDRRRVIQRVLFSVVLVWMTGSARGDIVDQVLASEHLGPATCATSQCHGKNAPVEGRNVLLNEYTTWLESDKHSLAYQTLESDQSKAIARKLGIKNPRTAKLCLDCHTDNVAADNQGPKFRINDGVGCEACHGGAGNWIKTHTDPDATHAANVKAGMIELEKGEVRAQLCLSCHLGTDNKFATHIIMGAGHPRLAFEMNLFTYNQPAHYQVDDDYIKRKGQIPDFNLWVTGQLESAKQTLTVAIQRMHDGVGMFPDFAFYDCHSCHHSQNDKRWTNNRADGLQPGSLRFHMPNLSVVDAIVEVYGSTKLQKSLNKARVDTLRGAQISKSAFAAAATSLIEQLDVAQSLLSRNYSASEIRTVRRTLLDRAAADRASDYAEAEQIYFSVETLCIALDDYGKCEPGLNLLFDQIADSDTFSPRRFAKTAQSISGTF